jgi:hypothetical protein
MSDSRAHDTDTDSSATPLTIGCNTSTLRKGHRRFDGSARYDKGWSTPGNETCLGTPNHASARIASVSFDPELVRLPAQPQRAGPESK